MLPPGWKIEGPFTGLDPIIVYAALGAVVMVIAVVAVIGLQVARLQPKIPPPGSQPARRPSSEFDAWTERPKSVADKDAEYQSLYGSRPGPASYVSSRAPAAPPVPPMGEVVVNLGGAAPPVSEGGWVDMPREIGPAAAAAPPVPPLYPPRRATGPSDEVVAPSHVRRGRDSSTGMLPSDEPAPPSFERSSTVPGALPPRSAPGDPFSPKAPTPPTPPPPSRGSAEASGMKVAQALPEGTAASAPTRGAFRQRGQASVGAAGAGLHEGDEVSAGTKAIRCPKCATVFSGPATRPATVKCPACGTSGTLR